MKTIIFIIALIILAAAVFYKVKDRYGESSKQAGSAIAETLVVDNNRFMPTLTTIKRGQSVVFENKDSSSYTLVPNQKDSPTVGKLSAGQSKQVIFDRIGTFRFQDQNQSEINVTVVVE